MMSSVYQSLLALWPKFDLTAIVDIFIVAVIIYQFIIIVRGRRSAHITVGVVVVLLVYMIAVWAKLELLRSILAALAPYSIFALIVLFQAEIRRLLARLGRRRFAGVGSRLQSRETADEVILAVTKLAEQKTGALIVLERDIGLRTFVESGVALDAALSRDLLLSIFMPGTALHDGAVIIQGNRIAAAACFLPLSVNPNVMRNMGTRHRAGIGITEETDCLAIIVSEERGCISLAAFGDIESDVSEDRLEERLATHLGHRIGKRTGARAGSSSPAHLEADWPPARQ
ncbi:MAG TPA: TIGR00159 family protein [Solibacterales bacterium]|nr:TIGR00159 family protein [Bryobacterales bacterium]